MKQINKITAAILDCSMKIHRDFGPGMLESVYEGLLAHLLTKRGFAVERQKTITFEYDGIRFEEAFRMDLLVDGCVVVELKSAERMQPVFFKQVQTYLKLTGLQVGMVVNFGMATLKDGIMRVVVGYKE